jgi:hypothetical protein
MKKSKYILRIIRPQEMMQSKSDSHGAVYEVFRLLGLSSNVIKQVGQTLGHTENGSSRFHEEIGSSLQI